MEAKIHSKYNGFQTSKGNYIWAAALGLAWKELKSITKQEEIKIITKSQTTQEIVENFNKTPFLKEHISQDSIYVKAGFGQNTVDLINTEVKIKFPEKSLSPLTTNLSPQDIIAYAYLRKALKFKIPFTVNSNNSFKFCGQVTPSFFADNKSQRKQIFYYYYKDQSNFCLSLKTHFEKDELILLKDQQGLKIDEVITKVQGFNLHSELIDKGDEFQMPKISLNQKNQITELKGAQFGNQALKQYQIGQIYQNIKLDVDETGVTIENEAVIMLLGCCMPPQPKRFILDKPFWIIMRQSGHHPYLAVYIKSVN